MAARGDTANAITLLTKFVALYANDIEAWEELASMYLQVHFDHVLQGHLLLCGARGRRPVRHPLVAH